MKKIICITLALSILLQAISVFADEEYPVSIECSDNKIYLSSLDGADHQGQIIIAEYDKNGKYLGKSNTSATVLGNSDYETEYKVKNDSLIMFWDGLDTMLPLAKECFCQPVAAETAEYSDNKAGGAKVDIEGAINDVSPTIEYIEEEDAPNTNCVTAVEVALENGEELSGVAEIRIKYDTSKNYNATNLIAGYFNSETNEWDVPCYYLDEEAGEAVILTDHFSKYGLFEVDGSGTPNAFALPLEASQISQQMFFTSDTILAIYNHETPPARDEAATMVLEALDGSFNGKLTNTGNNINTILTKGGKISTGVLGKISTQYTVIGVVGGCISTANNAYKHGVFSYNTLEAIGRTGIALGVSTASSGVQIAMLIYGLGEMSYNHVQAKKLTEKHNELLKLQKAYIKYYAGKRTAKDWYTLLEPYYNKYCSDMNDKNIIDNYAAFDKAVKTLVTNYAYKFHEEYISGELYGKFLDVPMYTTETGALSSDICQNYEAETWESLQAVLKQYSKKAYLDAQRGLAKECEELRRLLNGKITLNFYVATGSEKADIAPNCYVRFYDAAQKDLWRRDFDANGKASITFSLLSYNQLECPEYITVFDKKTDKAIGRIELPDNMEPDKSYDVPFDTDNTTYIVNIHEVKNYPDEPYRFAGLHGRLAPVFDNMYKGDFAFDLDEKGCAQLEMTYAMYFDNGSPKRVEIVDENDKVIYQTPYDPSMYDVSLDGSTYSLDIKCDGDDAIDHYKYRKAEIVYFENFDAKPTAVVSDTLGGDGKCTLMFAKYGYDFRNKDYTLYIYDEKGEKPERIFDLSESFGDTCETAEVVLEFKKEKDDDDDEEELKLDRETIFMNPDGYDAITAVSGTISEMESGDENIVVIEADGSIHSKDVGETYVYVRDNKGHEVKVKIIVEESIYDYVNPICRGCQIYSKTIFQGKETESYFDAWSRSDLIQPYARVTFSTSRDVGGSGIAAIRLMEQNGKELYFALIPETGDGRLYWSDYSGNVKKTEWIESYDFDSFVYVLTEQITSDMYRERRYYYERTDLEDYPSDETQ